MEGAAVMILEAFEIENFSCIKRLAVNHLPATGVIVLHGGNGTGKSSIVEALRACLMDNKSTSRALERGFPKNSSEKPRVTVTFRASGTIWKVMKQFGSKESSLHRRTADGLWKLETTESSDAHERTCQLVGCSDSTRGLTQLLWLTQAEFRLPEAKHFDADVQSRLRAILGVLQTPLDDYFLGRVKDEWSRWFGSRNRPGEKPKLKKECSLAKNLASLDKGRTELENVEAEFQGFERLMEQSADLEIQARDLRRQLNEAQSSRDALQKEFEESLKPLELRRLAKESVGAAQKELADAQQMSQRRIDTLQRLADAESDAERACQEAVTAKNRLAAAEDELRSRRRKAQEMRDDARDLQMQRDAASQRLRVLALADQANRAKEKLEQAETVHRQLETLEQEGRTHPAPDAHQLQQVVDNRSRAERLQADLAAAAISLTVTPADGSSAARVIVDGTATPVPVSHSPRDIPVCRRAEIAISGWGSIAIRRGSDARDVEQIEQELHSLDQAFVEQLAAFGVSAHHDAPLERLRQLAAEKKLRDPQIESLMAQLRKLAPSGLEPLRQEYARVEIQRGAAESAPAHLELPAKATELPRLAEDLKIRFDALHVDIDAADRQIEELERQIESADGKTGHRPTNSDAQGRYTTHTTIVNSIKLEVDRMLTAEQVEIAIQTAQTKLSDATHTLELASLTESQETVAERLDAAKDKVNNLDSRLRQIEREYDQISGQLRMTVGQHQRRAAAQARVEELELATNRETLESDAYDRLMRLFEECREKQLGAVMGPIHDRVLRWIKLLRIPGYQSIHFNDQFLPDQLVARGGVAELGLSEESIGTQEQLALMVRLALGSTLSTSAEPIVAVLDDPLTHSDTARLDRMRAVLRSAATGDPDMVPPAGPLQVLVFTCHPEWFSIDGATVIDLTKSEVLLRHSW